MGHIHTPSLTGVSDCPHCSALTAQQILGNISHSGTSPILHAAAPAGRSNSSEQPEGRSSTSLNKGRRLLLKGGTVVTMDAALGNFTSGDVLIEGNKIAAVGRDLDVSDADVVDAKGMIVMPGFIDTHRHMWQGQLRMSTPDGDLGAYLSNVLVAVGPHYTPEDVYASNLLSALGALNSGITTILDWSHISNTAEHSDAAVEALRDSGMRAVYAYSHSNNGELAWWTDDRCPYPKDIARIKEKFFSSDDQLVTMAMAVAGPEFSTPEVAAMEWKVAREHGCRITTHIGVSTFGMQGKFEELSKLIDLSDDATYIHCTTLSDTEWKIIKDTGGTLSIAPQVEMMMGHGMPPIQKAIDLGIRPSLSIDVETNVGTDMFTQMRFALGLQRAQSFDRHLGGDENAPELLGVQDALEFATIEGARANGMDHKVGSLTPGKEADIIVLNPNTINAGSSCNTLGAVVFAMESGNVDTVIVGGRVVKKDGKLQDFVVQHVIDRAIAARDRTLKDSGAEFESL